MSVNLGTRDKHIASNIGGITDYDGNFYSTVIIDGNEWIVENLRTTHYADGTAIPNLTVTLDWANDTTGAYCWFNNDIGYKTPYGALYNKYAVDNVHGLVYFERNGVYESGWIIPSETQYEALITYLGGGLVAGGHLKEVGLTHWTTPNTGADDSVGFKAIGATGRGVDGSFGTLHVNAEFWASTDDGEGGGDNLQLSYSTALAQTPSSNFAAGLEVRCMRPVP